LTFRACTKKERKPAIKNIDLTKYYASLTNVNDSRATFPEMMLMISEKHADLFGKSSASFQEKMLMFLVNECKSPLKTAIKLYKPPIFAPFYPNFQNVKDSRTPPFT
jgi:hypothetical protein